MNDLSKLSPGDKAIRESLGMGNDSVQTVQRVTKTLVFTEHEAFHIRDGRLKGGARFCMIYLKPADDAAIAKVERESRRHNLSHALSHHKWDAESIDKIEAVARILGLLNAE